MTKFIHTSAMLLAIAAMALYCTPGAARGQAQTAPPPKAAKNMSHDASSKAKPKAKAAAAPAQKPKAHPAAAPKTTKHAKVARPVKPAVAPAAPAPVPAAQAEPPKPEPVASKRDPFMPLLNVAKGGGAEHLPPGKAGLVVATVQIDGTVQQQNQLIAVVSNPERKVYFIREGDQLYDGQVEKITLDGVTFKETSKDAFGKPVERTVTKRIFASAGESQ